MKLKNTKQEQDKQKDAMCELDVLAAMNMLSIQTMNN